MMPANSTCRHRRAVSLLIVTGPLLVAFLLLAWGTRSSAADPMTLGEIKARLEQRRDGIKSLFVRYEEEAVPLIDPVLAFRWDVMQFRMKTDEHEAIEGAKRYHRTIHRGTAEALGDPTVVDPLSPQPVQERRRERAERYRMETAEAKVKGYAPPPRMFLVGPVDYEAGYDGQRFWRTLNGAYNLHPPSQFPGMFRGSIVNLPGSRDDYLQAIGLGVPDPTEQGGARPTGKSLNLLPEALAEHRYRTLDRTEVIDGARCVVVEARWKSDDERVEVTDRLWLDEGRGLALLRRETLKDGQLDRRIVTASHEEVSPGLWLPKQVEYQYASFPGVPADHRGKPLLARKLRVVELRVNDIPGGLFAIKPGAKVNDLTSGVKTPSP